MPSQSPKPIMAACRPEIKSEFYAWAMDCEPILKKLLPTRWPDREQDAFAFHGRPDARVALPQSSTLPNARKFYKTKLENRTNKTLNNLPPGWVNLK